MLVIQDISARMEMYFIIVDLAFAKDRCLVTTYEMRQIQSSPDIRRLNRQLSGIRCIIEKVW
jgi:hypothetical protein